MKELGAGYTFCWSGKTDIKPRISGVGFAIRNNIASSLTSLPKGISDRIMTLCLPFGSKAHLTLINVYAPNMTHAEEEREVFQCVPRKDKLLILGDFNARVGSNK